MERESCDYDIDMGKALHEDNVLKTVYLEKWNELLQLNCLKHQSVAVKKVRGRFEYHIKWRDL